MAKWGRTVRVSGLPTDIDGDRLTDKLFIHFLRAKNGGGEVDFVTIVGATPASALITFQESEVAHRVVQQSRHNLEVDGKMYKLTATEHHEGLEPDQVIVGLSAIVDCGQLPGGIPALKNLCESHADVEINCDAEQFCTLRGAYSKVQAALGQILGRPGDPQSAHRDSGQPDLTCSTSAQTTRKSDNQGSENHSRKPNRQREQSQTARPSSSRRDPVSGGYGGRDSGQTEGVYLWPSGSPTAAEEDFSLIMDADMFQYLQKQCWTEYQHILSQYGVEVVDMTNQGLTTLFLQVTAGVREGGQEKERLALAQKALSRLYQENETEICRTTLPKSVLSPREGLQKTIESLRIRLPKLLLNEDDRNIHVIGSSSDITEAKEVLLMNHDEVKAKKDDVASLLRYSSYDSSSFTPDNDAGATTKSSAEGGLDDELETDQRRAEGTRRYKLAPLFKESGLAASGSSAGRQMPGAPILGHNVFSDNVTFPRSTTQFSLSPPAESGSTLKRASSFSGKPQQKAQGTSQKSHDDSSRSPVKAKVRSSSFSTETEEWDKREVYDAEVTVSTVIWRYIKKAYKTRVADLTSDVKIKERPKGSGEVTVSMSGTNPSTMSSCQLGLQNLVESVSVDFSMQEVLLSELAISDPADETLQMCCTEVQSRYKKVSVAVRNNTLFLVGPQQLCSQVSAILREVFSGDVVQTPKQQEVCVPSTSNWKGTSLQMKEEQNIFQSNSQAMPESQSGQETGVNQESDIDEQELMSGRVNPPFVGKNPVVKERVRLSGTAEVDGQRANALTNNGSAGSTRHANSVGSATARTDKATGLHKERTTQQRKAEIQETPGESRAGQGEQGYICVCGDSGMSVMRTKCGVVMCSKCLYFVHGHCKVCHATDPTPQGIQGKMSLSKLDFSLPGHSRDSAIKITYCILDGIQGSNHPFPGNPFEGGLFEAFLPDCEKSRKLLPQLEKAFRRGLTFTVAGTETGARVTWDSIPHKTSLQGGKAGKGYPDAAYLTRLAQILTAHGIDEQPAKSQE